MKYVSTNEAPAAIGPYSQAVLVGDFLFTSGQIALSAETGEVVGDNIKAQAQQVMKNLESIARAGETSLDNTVKTTCFLADMNDFAEFNEVYGEFFKNKPARSCVAVKTLPKGVLCEVEAIIAIK